MSYGTVWLILGPAETSHVCAAHAAWSSRFGFPLLRHWCNHYIKACRVLLWQLPDTAPFNFTWCRVYSSRVRSSSCYQFLDLILYSTSCQIQCFGRRSWLMKCSAEVNHLLVLYSDRSFLCLKWREWLQHWHACWTVFTMTASSVHSEKLRSAKQPTLVTALNLWSLKSGKFPEG